jgi:poly(3-hydroxybutyrate) depolymerase
VHVLYYWYELSHAAMRPARAAARTYHRFFNDPLNPLAHTAVGRHAAAVCEVFERTTRRYVKPEFDLRTTRRGGREVAVVEEVVYERPFCRLLHFKRDLAAVERERDPRVLLVAPMSGHFATLLRGTVEALLPDHEVYITDWQDAATVPLAAGTFDLDDYVLYLRDMLRLFGGDVHVYSICQPAVPVLAAIALMEEDGDPNVPRSLIMAGGPVDTRINPTAVNLVAESRGTDWFRTHVVTTVPWPNAGAGRSVYPGFLQLSGFMSMNIDRHARAHKDLFLHLVRGDGDSAEKHRVFYDEYLAVMDLTAEFYLQTVDTVFVRHALPKGEMMHRGRRVDPSRIRRVALMTIEGENDDITGRGQCRAAHDLCPFIPSTRRLHYECPAVGHYGIFNGSRFRADIAPRVAQFIRTFDPRGELIPLTSALDQGTAPARAASFGAEPSSVAFTFAPANDTAPDLHLERLQGDSLRQTSRATRTASSPQTAPFRLLAMAANLMIDGVFRVPGPAAVPQDTKAASSDLAR